MRWLYKRYFLSLPRQTKSSGSAFRVNRNQPCRGWLTMRISRILLTRQLGAVVRRKTDNPNQRTTHPTSTPQVPEQVPEQVKGLLQTKNPLIIGLIKAIGDKELSIAEMMKVLGLKHRPNFLQYHLNPAMKEGYICMLYPNSPRHPRQKYLLTVKGTMLYQKMLKVECSDKKHF